MDRRTGDGLDSMECVGQHDLVKKWRDTELELIHLNRFKLNTGHTRDDGRALDIESMAILSDVTASQISLYL